VKFNGTPLPGGVVTFASESNPGQPLASGSIETDGSYRVQNLPKGGAVIAVQGPSRSSKQEDKDKPFIVIPVKYQDAKESGLKLTVQDGEQVFDIDLTSLRR